MHTVRLVVVKLLSFRSKGKKYPRTIELDCIYAFLIKNRALAKCAQIYINGLEVKASIAPYRRRGF